MTTASVEGLSARILELETRLASSEGALAAIARGEVDTVTDLEHRTSILLRDAQDQLRRSEAAFRSIFEGALDALVVADDEGTYYDVNPAACALFGVSRDVLLGKSTFAYVLDEETARQDWSELLADGSRTGEYRIRRPDGEDRLVEYAARADVRPGFHLSILRDVTERRAGERARDLLAAIVNSSGVAVTSVTLEGVIDSWNPAAEQLYRVAASAAIGRPYLDVVFERRAEYEQHVERCRRGETVTTAIEHPRGDGGRLQLSLARGPIRDRIGTIVGVSTLTRDIAPERKLEASLRMAEEQVQQLQRLDAVGGLAAGIAHDLNNVLTVILSSASLLRQDLGDSPLVEGIQEIEDVATRASKLVHHLLAFGRKQTLKPEVIDPDRTTGELLKVFRRVVGEHVEITHLPSPQRQHIYVDPSQLEQVLLNLVVNARDAMPSGGRLTISTAGATITAPQNDEPIGEYACIAVTDTGVGMDRQTMERMFEPFFTTKEPGKGTGLGLSTVFGIVRQSGGFIRAKSERGAGTSMEVYIPSTLRQPRPRSETAAAPTGTRGETVLIVEDDDHVRRVVEQGLRREGYKTLVAANAVEALRMCEHQIQIDLLLTDVVMPEMNGRDLAAQLRGVYPGLRVLFFSGYQDDGQLTKEIGEGVAKFLEKPVTTKRLVLAIREVLDASD